MLQQTRLIESAPMQNPACWSRLGMCENAPTYEGMLYPHTVEEICSETGS